MWHIISKYIKPPAKNCPVAIERRHLHRIKMELTIVCHSKEHPESFRIVTENVNTSGIKFFSQTELTPGELLEMTLLLHINNIEVKGKVIWCERKVLNSRRGYAGGLQFLTLSDRDKKYLDTFIHTYSLDGIKNS